MHFAAVIEPRVRWDIEERFARAGLRIGRAVDEFREARVDSRTSAHRARFERHGHRATFESPLAELSASLADGDDLGVSGWIRFAFAGVGRFSDNLISTVNHRGDWYFASERG